VQPNRTRPGVYASDFKTADKLVVEVLSILPDESLREVAIAAIISPGDSAAGDGRLDAPTPSRVVASGGSGEVGAPPLVLSVSSQTITRSGYSVKRKHLARAQRSRDGKLYVVAASARSDLMNAEKESLLRTLVDSFQLL
jgi:hypothetical protein